MTIFEFAKKMEKDGENYYRELALITRGMGLPRILNELADEEVNHFNVLVQMEQGKNPSLAETKVLASAKNIFAALPKEGMSADSLFPEIDLYKHVRDIEIMSQNFYEQKAEECENPTHKETFLKIAEQERQHHVLIENMLEFLQRPSAWLENAEWRHSDEY